MSRPWKPERSVGVEAARALIEQGFPSLAPARVEPLAEGWDNCAFVVNGRWVFRFPRRAVAAGLIEIEAAVLPAVAPRLPSPVPVPELVARGGPRFPWPFAGYRMLPGRTADAAGLADAQRAAAAAPLAEFLAALHAIGPDEARPLGAPPDELGRLDVPRRRAQAEERLERLCAAGALPGARPWRDVLDATPQQWSPRARALVHGDLHARNVLVDGDGRVSGVIDWGDVHVGEPALDLAIAQAFLPPAARRSFRAAYGPVDEPAWAMARFKALDASLTLLHHGREIGDRGLAREARGALERVLED